MELKKIKFNGMISVNPTELVKIVKTLQELNLLGIKKFISDKSYISDWDILVVLNE